MAFQLPYNQLLQVESSGDEGSDEEQNPRQQAAVEAPRDKVNVMIQLVV